MRRAHTGPGAMRTGDSNQFTGTQQPRNPPPRIRSQISFLPEESDQTEARYLHRTGTVRAKTRRRYRSVFQRFVGFGRPHGVFSGEPGAMGLRKNAQRVPQRRAPCVARKGMGSIRSGRGADTGHKGVRVPRQVAQRPSRGHYGRYAPTAK